MSANTGGTAFPLPDRYAAEGMTLLDWYAGQLLTGYVAHNGVSGNFDQHAKDCYDLASAMLAEKARREVTGKRDLQVEAVVKESLTTEHSEESLENVAKLEAANKELVEALEWVVKMIKTTANHKSKVALSVILREVDTILAKHKGAA